MFKGVFGILEPYKAGKGIEEISEKYGLPRSRIIKLGSNEFPYNPPQSVRDAIYKETGNVNRYPDPSSKKLKEKLSEYTGLPPRDISVGNGASEVLDTICKITLNPFDKVVVPVPTYSLFIFLSMLRDASIEFVGTEGQNFEVKAERVIRHSKDAKLVFLCSPNNPTGKPIHREEIMKIVENTDAIVIVDEAYYEFFGETVAEEIEAHDNLVAVRSMSKFFGLAGLRVGYALSCPEIIRLLEKARLPFNVNAIAQRAAIKAIEEEEWFRKKREDIIKEKKFLMEKINEVRGLAALPSETNFLLVRLSPELGVRDFVESLLREGVIVRDVTGAQGLKDNYIRITIGRREENRRLVSVLQKIIA